MYRILFTFFLHIYYIIYKLKYIGLYIVNSDELQTNVLQTKWKVLASINMMGNKMYTYDKNTLKYVHLHLSIKRTWGKRKHKEQECAENMQQCAGMCKNVQKCANVKYN